MEGRFNKLGDNCYMSIMDQDVSVHIQLGSSEKSTLLNKDITTQRFVR